MRITEDDINSPRGDLALDLLRSGTSVRVDDLSLRLAGPGEMEVVVWSGWRIGQAPEGAEEEEAVNGALRFASLVETWADLRSLVAGFRRTVLLGYDYGSGSVVLGRLSDDGKYTRA